jgi:glycine C-acetyltransferase
MLSKALRKYFSTASPARQQLKQIVEEQLNEIKQAGTYKRERIITSSQAVVITSEGKEVLNFCANNYLGLSNNKELIETAKKTLDTHGFGLSSVRFICGTQDIHKQLEKTISKFHSTEDTILFGSCFDANAGFFEAILDNKDAVISDTLNHASIIDGIRLCKANRFRYEHLNMTDLELKLKEASKFRTKFIVTDGVFSMDGDIAPLDQIVDLAKKYKANVFVDESHSSGFIGATGRGTPELFGVTDEIDVINSTLGKALGGGTGGYTTGRAEVVDLLRQKARPYLFSNSVAPSTVGASLKVFDILTKSPELRNKLNVNTKLFRERMKKAGFKILGHDESPIAPVWLGDAKLAVQLSEELMHENIYVIGFSYPVVPKGEARIRVQLSAGHTQDQVNKAVDAFIKIGKKLKVI